MPTMMRLITKVGGHPLPLLKGQMEAFCAHDDA
jgi:hypothetical protein